MDNMSPQLQQDKRRMKSQSYRRQSAPSLVLTKALSRSKTLSRESFLVPVCPETCPLVQSLLGAPGRSFLLHGHVQMKTGMQTQDRHMFLFNDILVIAKARSANQFKQKARVRVCELWTASCMEEVCEGSTDPDRSFVMGWPTCNCVATFSSAEHKDRWLSLLKSWIKEEKDREEPKTIPMRVYGKGINAFAVTKTLAVSNSDSTNEVVRLALQQFGIIGNVKDYQLWVISKRDNAPYPLIGHEFPFSIHMSHVRPSWIQGGGGGGRDAGPPPSDGLTVLQEQQQQAARQCQFILKPRPIQVLPQGWTAEFRQKSFKRRRSFVTWAFWRGSSSHLADPSAAGATGCLFGRPLSAVCPDGALPKPVMDMLTFLYHEGSWTRGIFRRPAGARAVRELRDSLDAGDFHLPLTREHIFIIAGVFKDFLRSIPGGLLCSELHEEWMDVLVEEDEDEDEDEQIQDVRRMLCRLPKEKALLLRHLLAVLHGIQSNAEDNQMTSFNLSVCIAPSLLWPPGAACSPEAEGEGAKKVCELVKFMIDHCEEILGQEPSSLFGGAPPTLSSEDVGSGPLTDSSYDSLENELDTSSGGSPGLPSKQRHGSLDSVLTFGDYDQDAEGAARRAHGADPGPGHTPSLGFLSLERRRSEPALAYVTQLRPFTSGRADAAGDEDESGSRARPTGRGESGGRTRAQEASSSSLSSAPPSPAPTRSSMDSVDSLGDGPTARATGGHPKETLHWGKVRRGLHPNSWLKKHRRLSLTQQENDDKTGLTDPTSTLHRGRATSKAKTSSTDVGRVQQPHRDFSSPPSHHRSTGNLQCPSASPCLSLFKPHRSVEETPGAWLQQRRRSEPGRQLVERAALSRTRLPSDPGLKVSEVDSPGPTTLAHFCLSPCAAKSVRDYFSSHPRSHPQSGQRVALALVETHREWLKRCSDPTAETDFDKLLFAEESYV